MREDLKSCSSNGVKPRMYMCWVAEFFKSTNMYQFNKEREMHCYNNTLKKIKFCEKVSQLTVKMYVELQLCWNFQKTNPNWQRGDKHLRKKHFCFWSLIVTKTSLWNVFHNCKNSTLVFTLVQKSELRSQLSVFERHSLRKKRMMLDKISVLYSNWTEIISKQRTLPRLDKIPLLCVTKVFETKSDKKENYVSTENLK